MKPATNKTRALRAKLEALVAAPGTPDEGNAAAKKLARLLKNWDFSQIDVSKDDIFKGDFEPANAAAHIYTFANDYTIANAVKWAVEQSTGILCTYHGDKLMAQAAPSTANKLAGIALTISESMAKLWDSYLKVAGTIAADRGVFIMGLYDGMMGEFRPAMLPSRSAKPEKVRKAKRKAVAAPVGMNLHPYSVAIGFGKQIRFSTPWSIIAAELEPLTKKEIEA